MSAPELIPRLQPLVDRLRTDVHWIKRPGEAPVCVKSPLVRGMLARHLNGGPAFGASPIAPGTSVTMVAVLDFDAHKGESTWDEMRTAAVRVSQALEGQGYRPIPFRSSGGHGIHLYLLWDSPQDAYSVRRMLAEALATCALAVGTKGVARGQVEVFPKQDSVPVNRFGSMFVLPLAGQSVPLEPLLDLAPLSKDAPFIWASSPDVPLLVKPERELPASTEASTELATFRAALAAIPNDLDYDAWRNVVFSIHHATGGSDEGLALAHEFSSRCPEKYDPDFLDTHVWPYITSERETAITDRYVLHLAGQHGFVETAAGDFLVEPAVSVTPPTKRHPFTPIPAVDFAVGGRAVHWLVKEVIPAAGLTVIYGASGSGKTFFALDLALSISQGEEWRTRRTRRGKVVYVAAEGAEGFRRRLRAYALAFELNLASIDLHVIAAAPSLLDRAQTSDLAKHVYETIGHVDLTIFDTLARVTAGGNENSGEDMGRAMKNAEDYAGAVGGSIVLIHHSGKDEARGARGWSGVRAAVDAEIEVTRADDDRVATVTKLKDGEEGAEFSFRLRAVPLGLDEDGEEVTSCVVQYGELAAATVRARKRLGEIEHCLFEVVGEMRGGMLYDDACEEVKRRLPEGEKKRLTTIRRSGANLVQAGMLIDTREGWRVVGEA